MGLFLGSGSGLKTFLEPKNFDYQFLFWKYSPIILFLIRPNSGPFSTFWAFRGYFWGWGQVPKLTNNFCFGSIAISFCFNFGQIFGLFTLFGPFGAIFGVWVRFSNLGLTNIKYHFWFWKYSPIFLFFGASFALFGPFGANFRVWVWSKRYFGTFLHRLTTFIFEV